MSGAQILEPLHRTCSKPQLNRTAFLASSAITTSHCASPTWQVPGAPPPPPAPRGPHVAAVAPPWATCPPPGIAVCGRGERHRESATGLPLSRLLLPVMRKVPRITWHAQLPLRTRAHPVYCITALAPCSIVP